MMFVDKNVLLSGCAAAFHLKCIIDHILFACVLVCIFDRDYCDLELNVCLGKY